MTTERFTLDEFMGALPRQAEHIGLVKGEHCFKIPLGKADLIIRSSIDESGIARDSGDDSIRFVLMFADRVLGTSADTYTQRTAGWQGRLLKKIEYLIGLRQQALDCTICHKPKTINLVKKPGPNQGKIAAWCVDGFDHKGQWQILNPDKPAKPLDSFIWPGDEKKIVAEVRQSILDIKTESTLSAKAPSPSPAITWDEAVAEETGKERVVASIASKIDLSKLNSSQLRVVLNAGEGIAIIDSTPGSGKTYCLETLVAYMIVEKKIDPATIGCFTFTRKAASEMRRRIAKKIWPDISDNELKFFGDPSAPQDTFAEENFNSDWVNADPTRKFLVQWVCTIHALCLRLLKVWYGDSWKVRVIQGDYKKQSEVDSLIRDSLTEMKWKENLRSVKAYIGGAIRSLTPVYRAEQWFHDAIETMGGPAYRSGDLAEIYERYLNFMNTNKLIDFDMMQAEVLKLINTCPAFVEKISHMFRYILADEAQDTDLLQFKVLCMMASHYKNLSYIGDQDQLLYAWRGAAPEMMSTIFEKHWDKVQRFQLPINYRSSISIINTSSKFIKSNYPKDKEKYMKSYAWRPDAPQGLPLDTHYFQLFSQLASECVSTIVNSDAPGDWFILSRTRAECAAIHSALISAGVPAINKSGGLIFGAAHIRKVLAYAALAADYNGARDNIEILSEVANVASKDFVSSVTRRRHDDDCPYKEKPWGECSCTIIVKEGKDHNHTRWYGEKSIIEARGWDGIYRQTFDMRYDRVSRANVPTVKARGAQDLIEFVDRAAKYVDNAHDCVRFIIDECVLPWLMVEKGISVDDPSEGNEMEDFAVITSMITEGMTVVDFLKEVDRLTNKGMNADEDKAAILGTVHWAKGAERPRVIVNMTRMPIVPPKAKEDQLVTSVPATIEEERCIAYVASTRPKDELHVYASKEWLGQGLPRSIFYDEIRSSAGLLAETIDYDEEENDE